LVWVGFDWSNEYRVAPATTDTRRSIPPGPPTVIVFRTPPLGASLRLRSLVPNLYANAIIHYDNGADPQAHSGFLCLGEAGWE
jgi:hypothetical protein